MKVLFFDPTNSVLSVNLVAALRNEGINTEHCAEMGYEEAGEISALLNENGDGEAEYNVLVCFLGEHYQEYLPRILRYGGVKIPFIFITPGNTEQRAELLEQGVSYCLGSPAAPRELIAVINAQYSIFLQGAVEKFVHIGNLMVDIPGKRALVNRGTEGIIPLHLTGKEYSMLELLVRNEGRTLSKEQIMNHLYLLDGPEIKIVDVFVCKLRKKLKEGGADAEIQTVWGRGYRMFAPTQELAAS